MSGHRSWSEIRNRMHDSPEARAKIDEGKRIMDTIMTLHQLREQMGVSQEALARAWETSQANVSKIERKDDLYLSSIRRYVEALGGEMEVHAVFPDQTIELSFGRVEPYKTINPLLEDEPASERKAAVN